MVAKDHGIPAVGLDVFPLSVLVSKVKIADYDPNEIEAAWQDVRTRIPTRPASVPPHEFPLVRRAFTPTAWRRLVTLRQGILSVSRRNHREFLQAAYLRAMREVCRAQSDGGWLRWTQRRPSGTDLLKRMDRIVSMMISDVRSRSTHRNTSGSWEVVQGDARFSPAGLGRMSAVICSPPYPNRHDYSRVFAPELLLALCDAEELKRLRYESFRSHVEAKAPYFGMNGYVPPPRLAKVLKELREAPVTDRRVPSMIDGYFEDLFLTLRALRHHLLKGARLAFVVGNVRHAGVMVEVDEYLAQIAEELGYTWDESWVIRHRGNSAQQMGKFGRQVARESVVLLKA